MKLPTVKTSGKVRLTDIRLLLYGPPKIGKSTLASGFPNAIFLATEKGYSALQVFKLDIKKWEDFQEALDEILEGKHKFETVVIDTIDLLYTQCVDYVVEKLGIDHPTDSAYGKGYDMINKEFEREINKLFMSDYAVILLSHTKTVDIVSKRGTYSKTSTSLPNSARRVILPKVSTIGYMHLDLQKVGDNKYVEKRVISFKPSEEIEGGDRDGRLPEEIMTYKDPRRSYEIFRRAYEG